jgi:hypothetical protein
MRFTLDIDLDQLDPEMTVEELGRILRYWAGNVKHYEFAPGDSETVYDSSYTAVGAWSIRDS